MANQKKNFLSINDYNIKFDADRKSYKVFVELDDKTIGVISLHQNFLAAILKNSKTRKPSK